MQKAYSGWEPKACSGSHGSFPAVPTSFAGEDLHDGVVTRGFCLSAGSGDPCPFQGELPGAGHRWSLWQRRGWTVPVPRQRPREDVPVLQHSGSARGPPPPRLLALARSVNSDCGSARCEETGRVCAASVEACEWWACCNFHP